MKKLPLLAALLCASIAHADDKPGSSSVGSTSPKTAPQTKARQGAPKTRIEEFLLRKDVPIEQYWSPCPNLDIQDGRGWDFVIEATVAYVKGKKNIKEKGLVFNFSQDGQGEDAPTLMRYLDMDEAEALSKGLLALSNLKGIAPLAFEAGFKSKCHLRVSSAFGENGRVDTTISAEGVPNILLGNSSSHLLEMKKAVDFLLDWLKKQ